MIRDASAFLANNASVAAGASTIAVGTGCYDTAASSPSAVSAIFDSPDLFLVIRVRTAIITGGSAGTIIFQFVSAATTTITSSPNVHWQGMSLVTGSTAAAGSGVGLYDVAACFVVPKGAGVVPPYLRYLGVLAVIGTTTITAGAVDAFLTKDAGFWAAIPQAAQ